MTRKVTNKILEAVEEGLLDRDTVIHACLEFMSEDDVAKMAHANEFFYDEDEEEYDEDEEPEYPQDEIDAEEEAEAYKADDWYALHGLDPLGDIEFEDSEDT